jgi:hypothetical protein
MYVFVYMSYVCVTLFAAVLANVPLLCVLHVCIKFVYVCMCVYVCVYARVCVHVSMYVCLYVFMCIYVCVRLANVHAFFNVFMQV